MDLETLRVVIAFAESGCNLTRAGKALGLSQPAVHARLAVVSENFGKEIYERRGRALVLTAAGEQILGWARDVLAQKHGLEAALRGDGAAPRVVIACGEGILAHVLGRALAPFAKAHPAVLAFLPCEGAAALRAVARGDAHLAVTVAPTDGLLQAPTLTGRPWLEASPVALGAGSKPLAVPSLLERALLLPPRGRPLRERFEELATLHDVPLRVAAEVTGWEAVVALAKLGVGTGIVNDFVATPGLTRASITGASAKALRVRYQVFSRRGRMLARSPGATTPDAESEVHRVLHAATAK